MKGFAMSTQRDTPDPCEALLLDNQVCFALHSTSLLMTKVYKPLLQALGLTYPQYLDPGSLTPLLKRLEAEGLLSRTRSREDERVVIVELTEQGRALQKKALDIPQCILAASGQTLEQLKKLQLDLQELRGHLQDSL
jgi:DNA-binding HxlR family transcriptional regulator